MEEEVFGIGRRGTTAYHVSTVDRDFVALALALALLDFGWLLVRRIGVFSKEGRRADRLLGTMKSCHLK